MSENQIAAIAILTAAGFVQDGATHQETVRIGSMDNPIYGGIGGKLTTLGGRPRFHREPDLYATVGPRTVCLYIRRGWEASGFVNIKTKETERIREEVDKFLKKCLPEDDKQSAIGV